MRPLLGTALVALAILIAPGAAAAPAGKTPAAIVFIGGGAATGAVHAREVAGFMSFRVVLALTRNETLNDVEIEASRVACGADDPQAITVATGSIPPPGLDLATSVKTGSGTPVLPGIRSVRILAGGTVTCARVHQLGKPGGSRRSPVTVTELDAVGSDGVTGLALTQEKRRRINLTAVLCPFTCARSMDEEAATEIAPQRSRLVFKLVDSRRKALATLNCTPDVGDEVLVETCRASARTKVRDLARESLARRAVNMRVGVVDENPLTIGRGSLKSFTVPAGTLIR